ncbi:MAG: tRNA threonylcarbamoyladenosine dehydratase, partial [Bacteroidales bacterium]
MTNWFSRTELLLGEDKLNKLRDAHVLVVGVGGVGAYAAEMICRAGVGRMTIVDGDTVNITNINRQLVATHSTIGESKVDVLAKRLLDINPDLKLTARQEYLKDDSIPALLDADQYTFV